MLEFPKLFIPGPTYVSDEILKVLSTPQIGHRTPEISKLIQEITLGIKKVLYTKIYPDIPNEAHPGERSYRLELFYKETTYPANQSTG